jgi:hypothetical protein
LKKILELLEKSYDYPVEIEFTINFTKNDGYKINLLQCRPLQTRGLGAKVKMPEKITKTDKLFASQGYFLGGNISQKIDWIIYVNPQAYTKLTLTDKYETARIVGNLNRILKNKEEMPTLLMGPGRWGTTTSSLGVPVKFAEINNVAVLAEVAFSAGNLMPELSFGTHFFQDLVETNIFYVALFPDKENCEFNIAKLAGLNNSFVKFLPEAARYEDVIGVYDLSQAPYRIISDVVSQKIICFKA